MIYCMKHVAYSHQDSNLKIILRRNAVYPFTYGSRMCCKGIAYNDNTHAAKCIA